MSGSKKSGLFLIVLLAMSLIVQIPFIARAEDRGGNWEIVGDTVFVDDDRVYLSAEPHTIFSSGWVEFNFISKKLSGNIDVVFGFNVSDVTPKKPQIWTENGVREYRWIQVNRTGIIEVNNITGYLNLGSDYNGTVDIGNEWNTRIFLVNGTIDEEIGSWVIGFIEWDITEFPDIVLIRYISTEWEKEYYFVDGFAEWNPDYNVIDREFKDMTKWFLLSSVNVVSNKTYRIRMRIELPFAGNDTVKGKYAWGIKLSSDTIQQAIENNRFYFIDPWYDSSWLYKMKISVDSGDIDEDLINFPVMVYLNSSRINWSHVQDGLDDIRFVWDEEIILDYELEDYTVNNEAWFWVELPDISNLTDTEFHIYYGNEGATNGEDVEGTWNPNYKMVQHMVDETTSTILDSTVNNNDGAKTGANQPIEIAMGQIDSAQDFDGTNDYLNCGTDSSLEPTSAVTVECWFNASYIETGVNAWDGLVAKLDYPEEGYGILLGYNYRLTFAMNTSGGWKSRDFNTVPLLDTVYHAVATFNGSWIHLYLDGQPDGDKDIGAVTITWDTHVNLVIGRYTSRYFNGTIDEVRISNIARSESWIKARYETERDDLLDYEDEESFVFMKGYGEENENLGQFTDNYENDDNVSVAVNVINNQTLDCMELNITENLRVSWISMYFVEYFENFPVGWTTDIGGGGSILKNANHWNGSFSVRVYAPLTTSWCYAFDDVTTTTGDSVTAFHLYILGAIEPDYEHVVGLYDTILGAYVWEMRLDYHDSGYWIQNDIANSGTDVVEVNQGVWIAVIIAFDDTTNKVTYYIDGVEEAELNANNGAGDGNRVYIGDTSGATWKGYYDLDDLLIGDGIVERGLYEMEGYFITEDYLNYTTGNSLTLLTLASIPERTTLTVQFSNDNVTWVDNEGNIGNTAIEEILYAIDLRNLNYTDIYSMYTFTGNGDIIPRLFQSRLITTEGNGEPPPPDYSIIFLAIGLILMLAIAFLYVKPR